MSRLDSQIATVRTKLAFDLFLGALARALLIAAAVALAYVIVRTFTPWRLPREATFGYGLLGVTVLWGLIVALRRRPNELATATAIDDRLGLAEKFSTALHARGQADDFSRAAVLDAERVAGSSDVRGHFKLTWPKPVMPALLLAAIGAGVVLFVEPRNLFASSTKPPATALITPAEREKAKVEIQKAIARIDQLPKAAADPNAVRLAKAELQDLLRKPDLDPEAGKRKALSALQELQKVTEQATKTQEFADAKNAEKMLSKIAPPEGEQGAVAEAAKDMSKGEFDQALAKLQNAVDKFDGMDDKQKQDAARQMQQMANQLQQMANDPKQQQKMQQQMQQMGMNQQQQQQAQQLLQQAAQGNQQAAQQLQQMAQQAMKQMNNGQGPSQQQMQQAQQQLQQMQAQASGQQQAQQMSQAAMQMASAMRQAAGQNPQQSGGAKQGQSSQGQQAQGNQQANAAGQPGQQQGNQPGQQGGQSQQQQMQQAMQSMQQQMQQMQAARQDASQVAAAQQQMQQAVADAQNAANGNGQGNKPGQNGGQNGGQAKGQPGGQGWGNGHVANNSGKPTEGPDTPFTVDKKTSLGQVDDNGRLLAGSLVKSEAPKGESKLKLQQAAKVAEQEAAEEVDSDRIGKKSQKVVRDYFGSMGEAK